MKGLKLSAVYGSLTVLAGITAESPGLVALSLGLSLFIPVLFALTARESWPLALFTSLLVLAGLALYSPRALLDVLPFQVSGALFLKLMKKPDRAVLGGALALLLSAVAQELLFGLPPEVEKIPFFETYRWGIYCLSALLMAQVVYGITLLFLRREELFLKIKFGFWPVILFLVTGILSQTVGGHLKVWAANLLLVSLGLFTVQGISVLFFLLSKLSPLVRLLVLILVFIFPLGLLVSALILGFLDNWIDFRKLSGGGSHGSNPA